MLRHVIANLTIGTLALTGLAPAAAAAPSPASPTTTESAAGTRAPDTPELRVSWPSAPVKDKTVKVRVRRDTRTPVRAEVQVRQGRTWVGGHGAVTTSRRSFTLSLRAPANRLRLRVRLHDERWTLLGQSRAVDAPQPSPKVRSTRYRAAALRTTVPGQPLVLRFEARRGERVGVVTGRSGPPGCLDTVMRGPRGRVHQAPSDLWRIPRSGRYRVTVVSCWGFDLRSADLVRYRFVRVGLDDPREGLRRGRGTVEVGLVDAPSTSRVLVRAWAGPLA